MDDGTTPDAGGAWCLNRALGVVISEVLSAMRDAGVDGAGVDRVRTLIVADEPALGSSLAEFGVDSLTWMAILTTLEERFDVLLPDDVADRPDSYTILGLSRALAECLGRKHRRLRVERRSP